MATHRTNKNKLIIAVAMSGGVDSSVAAALLVRQGYAVIGLTMHVWDFESVGGNVENESACCSNDAMEDARFVCHKLGIPHYTVNLKAPFKERIISNFMEEYLAGRTPNPCVLCNSEIKWGALLQKAVQLGAERIATGHYVRLQQHPSTGRMMLLRAIDRSKDQAYALWGLSQAQLAQTMFPLGALTKREVRRIADELDLKTAHKAESQEICFIPDDNYERFLKEQLPGIEAKLDRGEILNEAGEVIGYHRGYPFYTIGQRKGLQVATGERIYINRIEPETNRIYVGSKLAVQSKGLIADGVNWVSIPAPQKPIDVTAKIRYNDPGLPAVLTPLDATRIQLDFESPKNAVTPGQSAVFYESDVLLGGGVIRRGV
ncbi:tRNA 2-thiouridine(34) synthase MnmA [candidate division KSB1 bacterium]|nr:tRNA 2-thiouridine(34) synthase MnmA [candidate division KSB1 bacterium]